MTLENTFNAEAGVSAGGVQLSFGWFFFNEFLKVCRLFRFES